MIRQFLFASLQYLVPQHALSTLFGRAANSSRPGIKRIMINRFLRSYDVAMHEAINTDPMSYPTFNEFFTRKLSPGVRPIVAGQTRIASPADGIVSQVDAINAGRMIQAKGHSFSVSGLFGEVLDLVEPFIEGHFITIYLAPKHYHRVHMPLTGVLREMIYVPGKLFSVNQATAAHVPNLFSRNERVVCIFDLPGGGSMAVALVGAMIVGSINIAWYGDVTARNQKEVRRWQYPNPRTPALTLEKGQEIGHFKMGSTVIVLFSSNQLHWRDALTPGTEVRMGELLGECEHDAD